MTQSNTHFALIKGEPISGHTTRAIYILNSAMDQVLINGDWYDIFEHMDGAPSITVDGQTKFLRIKKSK